MVGTVRMHPFVRIKMLDADEYRVLKKTVASRKLAAGNMNRSRDAGLLQRAPAHVRLGATPEALEPSEDPRSHANAPYEGWAVLRSP